VVSAGSGNRPRDAGGVGSLVLEANVDVGGRIVADEHGGQPDVPQLGDLLF